MHKNYELAIDLLQLQMKGGQFQDYFVLYLYLCLNSDFLRSQQLLPTFLIYSPFTIFNKTQNTKILNNYQYDINTFLSTNNLKITQYTTNLLKQHSKYIFALNQDSFQEEYDFKDLNSLYKIDFLKNFSLRCEVLGYTNIYLPYICQIDKKQLDDFKLNEYEFLIIMSIIPPKKLIMKDMSIQFIKSWYSINYYAPLTTETIIQEYDNSLIENSSISNLIQQTAFNYILKLNNQTLFRNFFFQKINKIKLKICELLYAIFNSLTSEPKTFKFDHSVLNLEAQFAKIFQAKYQYLIRLLYILYLFVCAFGIWYFSYDSILQCGASISKYSYIMYFCFGFTTLIVEAWLFQKCLNFISHLIPQMKPDCDIGFPKAQINQIKKYLIDIPWLNQQYANYSITFLLSQLSRFDFFTNIGFIFTTYQCKNYIIFYCALASIGSITFINLFVFFFVKNLFGNKEKSKLLTGHIDIFYQICNLLSFLAVADILDIISPSNCVVIKGKMYNQRIIGHFFKILLQDLPLIILQALQLVSQSEINETVILSLILSCVMFLVSLIKFLLLTPTTISQVEFNMLNVIKKEKVLPKYEDLLSDYEAMIHKYNIYEQLKCLKSQKYLKKQIEIQFKKDNKSLDEETIKQQLSIQQKLRTCVVNQNSILEMFGNTKFD